MDTAPGPRLSVYTIASGAADDCLGTIRNLAAQTVRAHIELIVVATDKGGVGDAELAPFGTFQWLLLPAIPSSGEAMAAAVRAARAPFVTYAEEHGTYDAAWAERLLAAHGRGYDVVAFAMGNANPGTVTSWAHLYGQFGHAVPPVESGETRHLPGHHTSYRRELLLAYGERLEDMMEDESALALDLHARGVRMWMEGSALSYHINLSRIIPYMKLDYHGLRSFAATRSHGWPRTRRLAYACATPLVPLLRMRRSVGHVFRSGRQRELLPQILVPMGLAMLAGMCGEFMGYVAGRGRSAGERVTSEFQRRTLLASSDAEAVRAVSAPVSAE